jgi:hypothetical protein
MQSGDAMRSADFTYTDLFQHAKNKKCIIEVDPDDPDVHIITNPHANPRPARAVVPSNNPSEVISDELISGTCAQLEIDPP